MNVNGLNSFNLFGDGGFSSPDARLRLINRESTSQTGSVPEKTNAEQPSACVNETGCVDKSAHEQSGNSRAAADSKHRKSVTVMELTPEEKEEVKELKKRDCEVKAHEQKHKAAAGRYASGGPYYEYKTGPDKNQYAISGSVNIDTGKVPGDPEATIEKARTIKRAANAPGDPSSQDRRVAAQAARMEAEAKAELNRIKLEESEEKMHDSDVSNQEDEAKLSAVKIDSVKVYENDEKSIDTYA